MMPNATDQSQSLLDIQQLSIGFPDEQGVVKQVVKQVSVSLNKGETLALVGESGSGKTMTALAVLQLLPINAYVSRQSRVIFEGTDLLSLSERDIRRMRGKKISLVFQDALSALNPVLTIGMQLKEVLRLHTPLSALKRHQRALSLLDEVGIPNPKLCLKSYPHQLSGGMKQRVLIAIALATRPSLLIADEPTTALDVTVQAQVLDLLKQLQRHYGMAMLFISHDLGVVKQVADHIAVMRQGELIEHKPATSFFKQPEHPYSQQLLSTVMPVDRQDKLPHVSTTSQPLLEVDQLVVQFSHEINTVDHVSFQIGKGETLALVGESGSGKTTTGRAILRLIQGKSGVIRFEGQPLNGKGGRLKKEHCQAIQVVFQDPLASMNPRMTVARLLEEGMKAHGIGNTREERQQRINELLEAVDMPIDCQSRYPHEFSGGQCQRICIARALSVDPKLIICDEPTSALDVCVQQQILTLLKTLQQTRQLSYLLITHDFGIVADLAHHVAVMYQGRIVEYGPTDKLLQAPEHPYTQSLLGAIV